MQVIRSLPDLRKQLHDAQTGHRLIAFVPTMGNLHAGHLALVREARRHADCVVVSIFVNPTQFGPNEDFDAYPRTLDEDLELLGPENVAVVFAPDVETMYPGGAEQSTRVEVPDLSTILCGAHRPGHFAGVATVVARLLNMVLPDYAIFGEKDYQQLQVIRRMVADLAMPVEIIGLATVREADGLAMSSRNRYLTAQERLQAPVLYSVLQETAERLRGGRADLEELQRAGTDALAQAGFRPDYFEIRRPGSLAAARSGDPEMVILAAAYLGKARLIDNLAVSGLPQR